jgi:hypothetical protein
VTSLDDRGGDRQTSRWILTPPERAPPATRRVWRYLPKNTPKFVGINVY